MCMCVCVCLFKCVCTRMHACGRVVFAPIPLPSLRSPLAREQETSEGSAAILKAVRADRVIVSAAFMSVLGAHAFRKRLVRGIIRSLLRLPDHLRHGYALPGCDMNLPSPILLRFLVRARLCSLVLSDAYATRYGLAHVHMTLGGIEHEAVGLRSIGTEPSRSSSPALIARQRTPHLPAGSGNEGSGGMACKMLAHRIFKIHTFPHGLCPRNPRRQGPCCRHSTRHPRAALSARVAGFRGNVVRIAYQWSPPLTTLARPAPGAQMRQCFDMRLKASISS